MAFIGTFPIDASTPVGLFRFEVGDVVGQKHTPDDGMADFEFMSDATIAALLAQYPNPMIAKSRALTSMATLLITSAQDIQVDDIKIKTVERAKLMLDLAKYFAMIAGDNELDLAFMVVPGWTDNRGIFGFDHYPINPEFPRSPSRYAQTGF